MNNTRAPHSPNWKHFDWLMFSLVFTLIVLGLLFQFSVNQNIIHGPFEQEQDSFTHYLVHAGVGVAFGVASFYFYSDQIKRYANAILIAAVIVLLYTTIFGHDVNYSTRWVNIGFYQIQTLPLILLSTVFYFSALFANHYNTEKLLSQNSYKCLMSFLLFALLLESQPDYKAVFLISVLIITILLTARWFKLAAVFTLSAMLTGLAIAIFSSHITNRAAIFSSPPMSIWDIDFQSFPSLMAIAGGGLSGVGFQESIAKSYLPDFQEGFLLAIVSEELGAAMVLLTLLLSCIIFYRCFALVKRLKANDKGFDALIVMSLSSFILLFCVANVATISDLLPASNIPYPFLSYGVSFWVFFAIATGLILRVDANFRQQESALHETAVMKLTYSKLNWLVLTCIVFVLGVVTLNYIAKSTFSDEYQQFYKKQDF